MELTVVNKLGRGILVPAFAFPVFLSLTAGGAERFTAESEGGKPKPATVSVDFSVDCGAVKPMNAVNNGPVGDGTSRHENFTVFKAARIPFARTHDTSEYIVYGGDHAVDISAVFPNFDADENDPKSYDFAVTDKYLREMRAAGTEPFYRLGQRIEHAAKRYHVYPPKDFAKWARICEHVIRHYNQGWAEGFHWNIRYWEIWNEPDIDADWEKTKQQPRMWGGTKEQFFQFYETAAKHLKSKFPELKIGGPAVTGGRFGWCEEFLKYQHDHETPMDFFSWHIYTVDPTEMATRAKRYRELMTKYGYGDKESILNEWNYVRGWGTQYHHSICQLAAQKGGAFTAAAMIACQSAPVDMLMYYDAKPDAHFNGMFDKTTLMPLHPYYAIYAWGKMAAGCDRSVQAFADIPDIYVAAARGVSGRRALFLARYSDDDNFSMNRTVTIRLANGVFPPEVTAHISDSSRLYTGTSLFPKSPTELTFDMEPKSFLLLEFAEPPPPPSDTFITATFNIRIDVDKGENAWQARQPRVAQVVKDGNFDLIGIQEVTETMWKDFVALFPDYEISDGPEKQGPNPILYRPQLFERIDSGRFALSERPDDFTALTWGSSSVRVCQWALLKHKRSGRLIRVFNQHPDWKSQESRSKGMALVLEKAKAALVAGELVIMTDDMNDMEGGVFSSYSPFDPNHPVGESIVFAKAVLRDAFEATETPRTGPRYSSHGYRSTADSRLDYIFVSDDFRVLTYRTHNDRPNGKFPSDHDAVSARIGIVPKK
ncbi:MAG: hypothetical protein IKR48_04365 [Kiritimatiellae bacterium]|nr:hypothetical protein [Kiritimatiellia bacterium]